MHRSNKAVTNKSLSRLSGEVLSILLAFIVATSISLAQTYTNWTLNGDVVNNGTIRVNRNIINNTTGLVTVSGTGVVVLQGNGAVQSHSIQCTNLSNTYPISIIRLDLIGTRPTSLNTPTLVPTQLRVGDGTTAYTAASPGFSISTQTLTIGGTSTYMATSTAALTFSGGTVLFNSAAAQSILNNAAGVTYGTLSLTAAGTKNLTTGGTVTAATLTQAGGSGQLSVTENMNVTGTATIADLGAISVGKTLQLTAVATSASISAMNNTGTGTFQNASNGTATITTLSGNAGTINQSGTSGTISFTNAAVNAGTITTATGTINFNDNLSGAGTITLSGNGNVLFGGSVAQTTYNLNNGTVTYNKNTAQSVIATPYNNLTIANAIDTSAANYKTAANTLTINGNLVVNAGNTLDMKTYSTSTFGAGSSNLGKLMWQGNNIFVSGTGVTEFYGNGATTVATGATYGNILFTGAGAMTISSAVTATGGDPNVGVTVKSNLTITGATLTVTGMDFNNIGTYTNNGTLTVN